MFDDETLDLARRVIAEAKARDVRIATAESCTGGLVAGALTAVAGSSAVLDRGFVTYSNAAKQEMLSAPAKLIDDHGAVSEEVARSMASGALAKSQAQVSVAVTGIAGPGGGSDDKPVGLVHFAAMRGDLVVHHEARFGDLGREEIRRASVLTALRMLLDQVAG